MRDIAFMFIMLAVVLAIIGTGNKIETAIEGIFQATPCKLEN